MSMVKLIRQAMVLDDLLSQCGLSSSGLPVSSRLFCVTSHRLPLCHSLSLSHAQLHLICAVEHLICIWCRTTVKHLLHRVQREHRKLICIMNMIKFLWKKVMYYLSKTKCYRLCMMQRWQMSFNSSHLKLQAYSAIQWSMYKLQH